MIDSGSAPQFDRNEGTLAPRTRRVDRGRHQLLAGAALALDQHGALVVPQALDGARHFAHGRRASDELGRRTLGEFALELAIAVHQAPALDGAAHDGADPVRILHGLLEVVEGAALHAADRALHRAVPGEHHHLDLGALALHALQDVEAAGLTQVEVEQHHVEGGVVERARDLVRSAGRQETVPFGAQDARDGAQEEGLVVHEKDQPGHGRGSIRRRSAPAAASLAYRSGSGAP